MKTLFIAYDQAHHDNVMEALNDSNVRGYTFFEQVGGRGTKGGDPHLGSHAWPSMNSAIVTIVDDEKVQPLLTRLKKLDDDNPMLGLRAFVWACEQSI
jgi:nitrogen regulatory protein PII